MKISFIDLIMQTSSQRFQEIQYIDKDYRSTHSNLQEKLRQLDSLDLSEENTVLIDELLTACNEESSSVCRLAYRQGYLDCVFLLKEIGVLPS